jgi:autotransporter-associated beta strand protein
MTPIRRCGSAIAVLLALALFGAAPALGATHTWIGPAGGLWSNAANWSGGKPTSGEPGGTIVQFGANTTSSVDIAGLTVDEIHFTGASNTISGSTALTISGSVLVQNVVSDAGGNTLGSTLPITITGAAVEAASSAGTLTIAGPVSGADGLVLVGGGGDFALTGTNAYTGATTLRSGALHITTPVGVVIAGSSLTIGDGLEPGARLLLDNSSDISAQTNVIVDSDGLIDFQSHSDFAKSLTVDGGSVLGASLSMTGALTLNDGSVMIAGNLSAGSLSMTGGTIGGTGHLALAGDVQATSSLSGPATVSSGVRLGASPTVTVASGTAPELWITGPIGETGGARGITKAGAGTLLTSGASTYTGTTTVSAGTLVADGSQPGPFSVGQGGTLRGSGTVGATSVAGVLAPLAPGLRTGSLSFGPTARLDAPISSTAPETIPSAIVTGGVAIDPGATANVSVVPGIALPRGAKLPLIDDDGSDAIVGQFAGLAAGSLLGTPEGIPLAVSYAGGDGNDLSLTPANRAPHVGSVSATPNRIATGRRVALSVAASDADGDPLTTTWSFGDGTAGAGAATSHAYAKAGTFTAVATVSDEIAQVQSSAVITVTGTPRPALTRSVKASAYGADFALTVPSVCVREGASLTVALTVKKRTGKVKGPVLLKVTKVAFTLGKAAKVDRSAPYRARLAVARKAKAGSRVKLSAKASLALRGGRRAAEPLTAVVEVCRV